MKTKRNVIAVFTVLTIMLFGTRVNAQETVITKAELPKPAQEFLDANFKEQKIIQVVKDVDYLVKTDYEVLLDNAMKLEFDGKGNWKEIDGSHNPVPAALVPEKIGDYVKQNFPMQTIIKMERGSVKYEVELANDLELEFTLAGEFLRIDD
ncbi:PepSY-like domain-containing protein [Sinomicrobium sp. M5D2P9]